MTITHQIVSSGGLPISPGGDILSQLSGLLGQGNALSGASVGLPGLQAIGSQIAGLAGSITSAGGTAGVDTSNNSKAISSLGSQMMTANSMSSMNSLLASLKGELSNLTNLLSPAGGLAQVLHSHVLDKAQGIAHSAFQGQHTVKLGSDGIGITSATKVAATAPILPHNGLTTMSDALQVTGGITGQSFGMLSDERLKTRIKNHPSVLDKVMRLKLKTFDVRAVDWELGEVHPSEAKPSFGLIAQEVQKVFPQVVQEGKFLTIEEGKVGLLLLAAFQEFVLEVRDELATLKQ